MTELWPFPQIWTQWVSEWVMTLAVPIFGRGYIIYIRSCLKIWGIHWLLISTECITWLIWNTVGLLCNCVVVVVVVELPGISTDYTDYTDTKLVRSLLFNLAITISAGTWFCQKVHFPSSLAKSSFGGGSDCLYEKYCANKRFTFFFSWEYCWLLNIKLAVICKPLIWQSSGIKTIFMDIQQ